MFYVYRSYDTNVVALSTQQWTGWAYRRTRVYEEKGRGGCGALYAPKYSEVGQIILKH